MSATKSEVEVAVLRDFQSVCPDFQGKAPIVKSCQPPEPDCLVSCSDGSATFFELRRIADPEMEQKINDKKIPVDEKGGFGPDDGLVGECVRDEILKSGAYKADGLGFDLLLYFDLLSPHLLPRNVIDHYVNAVIAKLGKGSFRKIWVFVLHEKQIIACY